MDKLIMEKVWKLRKRNWSNRYVYELEFTLFKDKNDKDIKSEISTR